MTYIAILVAFAIGYWIGREHNTVVAEVTVLKKRIERAEALDQSEPEQARSSLVEPQTDIEQELAEREKIMQRLNES